MTVCLTRCLCDVAGWFRARGIWQVVPSHAVCEILRTIR